MRRLAENFFDWIIEAPAWLRNGVSLLLAAAGLGLCLLAGRVGIPGGGKLGAILIAVGLVLFAADAFVE